MQHARVGKTPGEWQCKAAAVRNRVPCARLWRDVPAAGALFGGTAGGAASGRLGDRLRPCRLPTLHASSRNTLLITAKKVLLLAVGGGNDAVSSLLAVAQLRRDHQFSPETLDVLCPLPEGATYHNLRATDIPDLHEIAANTYRTIGPKRITNFPEAKLSTSGYFHRYYGADLRHGSLGLLQVLRALAPQYDLVLCVDVGGDFIAQDSNQNLLSPYMDSTVAYAVQHLTGVSVLGMVLGLSLDGESTPEQARAAVTAVVD